MGLEFKRIVSDENLPKINIDPRLVEPFKRVLENIQKYFDLNGYTKERDYYSFLKKYLIDGDFKFVVLNNIEKYVGGFYSKRNNMIAINEMFLSSNQLESILCHEFFHFLSMHDCDYVHSNDFIKDNHVDYYVEDDLTKFFNECWTESITRKIYPNSNGYISQIELFKFFTGITGFDMKAKEYLNGTVFSNSNLNSKSFSFLEHTAKFQFKYTNAGFIPFKDAKLDTDYIISHRVLVDYLFDQVKDYNGLCDALYKYHAFHVDCDMNYNNEKINSTFIRLINIMGIKDEELKRYLFDKLKNVSTLYYQKTNAEKFSDYDSVRRLDSEISKLSIYLDKKCISYYNELCKAKKIDSNLRKLEAIVLPLEPYNKWKSKTIYVATYDDSIVVLNNGELLGIENDINYSTFKGLTSNDESGAICFDEIGSRPTSLSFSTVSKKELDHSMLSKYIQLLEKNYSNEQKKQIFDEYVSKNNIVVIDDEDDILYDAIKEKAREEIANLTYQELQELKDMVLEEKDKFVLSVKDGDITAGILNGIKTVYQSSKVTIYSDDGKGLLNGTEIKDVDIDFDYISIGLDQNKDINFTSDDLKKYRIDKMLTDITGELVEFVSDRTTFMNVFKSLKDSFLDGNIDINTYNSLKEYTQKYYDEYEIKSGKEKLGSLKIM